MARLPGILRGVARVAALFSLVLLAMIVATWWQLRTADPLNSPAMLALRERFAEMRDPQLAEEVRTLDWLARRAFFSGVRQIRIGGSLLALCLATAGVCLAWSSSLGRPPVSIPGSAAPTDSRWRGSRKTRALVLLGTAILLLAMFIPIVSHRFRSRKIPENGMASAGDSGVETAARQADSGQSSWPGFRGPGGIGVAPAGGKPPVNWDAVKKIALRWQVPLELPGFSSPVIHDDRVLVTVGDAGRRLVVAYRLATGEELWKYAVAESAGGGETPKVTEDTGYAAPTPAVSGLGVCAIFANGDLVCLDLHGKRLWGRNLGLPENHYGHSSSLLIDRGILYVQYDHAADAFLMAFAVPTGKVLWNVERDTISWGSPALVETSDGARHLVLVNEETVAGYDPRDGSLLWREKCLGGEVAPSPAFADDMVFVANEFAQACAVTINGKGASKVLWTWDEALPDVASPVAAGGFCFLATSAGELICLDAATGTPVWRREFETGFYSSPVVVGDLLYLTDLAGTTRILRVAATYEEVGKGVLGEPCFATPAFADGIVVIRGQTHLFCFGDPLSEQRSE